MMKTAVSASLLALAVMAACSPAPADSPEAVAELDTETAAAEAPAAESLLDAAIASDLRSPEEKARDEWRHPKETLEFLGIEPDDTVVEIWPGGGWYTNILAPWLASGGGKLVAVLFSPEGIDDAERVERIETNNAKFKSNYTDPAFGTIDYSGFSANSGPLTEPGTADAVLTFRNIHNWMAGGYEQKFFDEAYAALKPGGVLGVVEHRLPSTAVQDPEAASGYVHEDYVKTLAANSGFEFAGSSEINANPADTADHPFGVWTLPPVSNQPKEGEEAPEGWDPEAYKAIGESDRMTLKFIKPAE
nr:methyltransferase domain-containing protein [uncultured Hyphomonas sp.]